MLFHSLSQGSPKPASCSRYAVKGEDLDVCVQVVLDEAPAGGNKTKYFKQDEVCRHNSMSNVAHPAAHIIFVQLLDIAVWDATLHVHSNSLDLTRFYRCWMHVQLSPVPK